MKENAENESVCHKQIKIIKPDCLSNCIMHIADELVYWTAC